MNKTIALVRPEPREVPRDDGSKGYAITVVFTDGEEGTRWANSPADVATEIERLKGLAGQDVDLNLTKPRDYQGVKQWTISGYPGAPDRGRRGGGGGMTNHQAALLAAASASTGQPAQVVLDMAKIFEAEWFGKAPEDKPESEGDQGSATVRPDQPSLSQVVTLRGLAQGLGWSEQEAMELAGVQSWAALTKATAQALISDWTRQLEGGNA